MKKTRETDKHRQPDRRRRLSETRKHNIVYASVCVPTGQVYVGVRSTDDLDDGYLGSGDRLEELVERHGEAAFRRHVLADFPTRAEAFALERRLVDDEFLAHPDALNIVRGGGGRHNPLSPAVRRRISEAQKRAQNNPELKAHQSRIQREIQNTPEAKARAARIAADNWKNPEYAAKMKKFHDRVKRETAARADKALDSIDAESRYRAGQATAEQLQRESGINRKALRAYLTRRGFEIKQLRSRQENIRRLDEVDAVRLYAAERSLEQIGRLAGTGLNTVKRYLLKRGVEIRSQGVMKTLRVARRLEAVDAVERYRAGASIRSISLASGVSTTGVRSYLVERGLEIRSKTDPAPK